MTVNFKTHLVALALMGALGAGAGEGFDFSAAWREHEAALSKRQPRTATNVLARIEREALAAKRRWPDAVKAFVGRVAAEGMFTDEFREEWIPQLTARIETAPAEMRPYLDLFLMHVYAANSSAGRWYGDGPTKLTDAAAAAKLPPWAPERLPASLEALFARVLAAADLLKAERAADWSMLVGSGTMPDSCRPTLYDLAVHDIIGFYGRTIPDKTLEKGLKLFDELIAFHRADTNLDAVADAELARIGYEHAFAELPQKEKDARYAKALDGFAAAYLEKSEVATLAIYRRAELEQNAGNAARAREIALTGVERWPQSVCARNCLALVRRIEEPVATFEAEQTWSVPFEPVKVVAKNVDKVFFKLVRTTFEEFSEGSDYEFGHREETEKLIRQANKAKPTKAWSVKLPHFDDYASHEVTAAVPDDLEPGYYYLFAGADDAFHPYDGRPYFVQRILVTDLALVTASDDRCFSGTVFASREGSRVKGALVELRGAKRWGEKKRLLATVETDADGVFAITNKSWVECRLRVVAGASEAVSFDNVNLWYGNRFVPSKDRVGIVTDRAIYRPGQTIRFKGYAAHVDPHARDFRVLPGARVAVELFDPNAKRVANLALTANEWGTFVGEFAAPRDRLTGRYAIHSTIIGSRGSASDVTFSVEEYKRPKFTVELGSAPTNAVLGREIELVGMAKTYSGLPVVGAKVAWRVGRQTRYPRWWWCFEPDDGGEVDKGEAVTDETGAFKVKFTPVPSPKADLSCEPSFDFTVYAAVTDTTGETRDTSTSCEIGTVAWRAEIAVANGQTADRPVEAAVSLFALGGGKVTAKGTLTVRRLKEPARPVRKPLDSAYWRPQGLKPGEWDWRAWTDGETVKTLAVEVKDGEWKGTLALPAGAYRLCFQTSDPSGKAVTGRGEVAVTDLKAQKLAFAAPEYFVVKRPPGPVTVGSTISVLWASGYDTGYGRVELFSNGRLVWRRDTDFSRPFVAETYTAKEEDRGQLDVYTTFFREGRLYTNHETVPVVWDVKDLTIRKEHFTSKLQAGAKESWTFRASGAGEVLAFMYDRSLEAFGRHFVAFPFRNFSVPVRGRPPQQLQNRLRELVLAGGQERRHWGLEASWRSFGGAFGDALLRRTVLGRGGHKFKRSRMESDRVMALGCVSAPAACAAPELEEDFEACPCECEGKSAADSSAEAMSAEPPIRKNLQETAFFLPQIETDADGRFTVSFTAPEAMSGWRFCAVVHDKALRSGVLSDSSVTTTRPLMVEPNAPRFVREGDDFRFAVKVTNNTDAPQRAKVSLAFEDLAALTPAEIGGGARDVALKPHETTSVEFPVKIPDGQGFLKYVAKAAGEAFADGEEGALAVLSRRVEVREAVQLNVRGKATKTFALTNLVQSAKSGGTIRSVDLSVRVVSRPAWYAVASLPYLQEYPHECCEQTFHRHYANALAAYVAKSDPRIRAMFDAWKKGAADALRSPLEIDDGLKSIALEMTPWVREAAGETESRRRMGVLFDAERIESESRRCLAKLQGEITGDDLLPWFSGGRGSPSITLEVLVGASRLEKLAEVPRPNWFVRVLKGLDRHVRDDVKKRLDWCKKNNATFHVNGFDLRWLYLHSFARVPAGDAETVKLLTDHLRRDWADFPIGSEAMAAIVLNRGGESELAAEVVRALKEQAVVSEEFGMYYRYNWHSWCSLFAAPVSVQALVVEAFKEVARDQATVDALNVWILKQRQTQAWPTTVATADAVYALLLGGGTDLLAGDALATVTLGGREVPKTGAEPGTGTYAASWRGADVKPEMGEITLTGAQEKGVVWGGVNWTYLEEVDMVRRFEPKELRIDKQYFRRIRTKDGERLEPVKGVLEQGDELVARLAIRADRTLEFVHIRDERPSSAEPVDVLSGYCWQDGVGYYQSTRDAATHYYIDSLGKGEFVLETSYRVQQRGTFSGGLAQIQCMYAPEFTAHSTSEKVEVK